jgi:ATP-dependent exoDNAse (exonuclease V) beta subunit
MKNMKELEEYIQKTEDNSLSMIVEVVKEFGNRLPGLISELKTHHTTVKEEADMIFSTVHRCKGMEYDEVTLLNDFFNEEKLKKVIAQSEGANISTHDKNRLTEEVNILYVAATRAKNKLSIPPEINPLQTVKLAPSQSIKIDSSYRRAESIDDWDLRYRQSLLNRKLERRTGNHGKRWTEMEEELVERMFHEGTGIKEIAKKLERGESGVRIKLISMGLLQVDGQE